MSELENVNRIHAEPGRDAAIGAESASRDRRSVNREAQVERIMNAATVCFIRSGFRGASMSEICAEAGMSAGALYRYFPSKEAIIEAIALENRRQSKEILDRMGKGDIVQEMVDLLSAYIEHVKIDDEAKLFCEIRAEALRNASVKANCDLYEKQMGDKLFAVMTAAKERGEIDPIAPLETIIPVLVAMGEGIIMRELPLRGISASMIEPVMRASCTAMLRPTKKPGQATGAPAVTPRVRVP